MNTLVNKLNMLFEEPLFDLNDGFLQSHSFATTQFPTLNLPRPEGYIDPAFEILFYRPKCYIEPPFVNLKEKSQSFERTLTIKEEEVVKTACENQFIKKLNSLYKPEVKLVKRRKAQEKYSGHWRPDEKARFLEALKIFGKDVRKI